MASRDAEDGPSWCAVVWILLAINVVLFGTYALWPDAVAWTSLGPGVGCP